MVLNWAAFAIVLLLVLGGLFAVLIMFSLSRAATGGDVDWQIDRIDRKLDLILTHLGIGHDEHVPESVMALIRLGKTAEAVKEYQLRTGSRASVARREIDHLISKASAPKSSIEGEV
ncbi:hypothetical protein [Paludisphaera mucosa]|uniref:Ribosomal protein L7/L12 C-terminal domain-containing protein n=1 Tax=Paludisphaera mucosa TaxID=3030827 RepID=A0ABT6F6Y3_9BACT|nr:hypothetical protein [Paludisphaera mucosa]MDG3003169.1 hypothetical protein [Paludisphaera mucosa]